MSEELTELKIAISYESLNLSLMSVSRLVKELVNEGICRLDGERSSNRMLGRRPSFVSLNTDYGWVVAVCLSAFSKAISIIDIAGNKRFEASIPKEKSKTPEGVAYFIGETVKNFLVDSNLDNYGSSQIKTIYMNEVLDNIPCSVGIEVDNTWYEKTIEFTKDNAPVSYTHLTLPPKRRV